jgi:sugar lactone lactonase YvrE
VTIEEQRLSEMLHRLTPEPPRHVTVEDVAIRLANQAAPQGSTGLGLRPRRGDRTVGMGRDGHTTVLRRPEGPRWGGGPRRPRPRWAPALAAAAVVAVVGGSAAVGVALTSHSKPTTPAGGSLTNSAGATSPATTSPTSPAASSVTSTHPPEPRIPIAGGIWNAMLINREAVQSDTLVGGGTFVYAVANGYLLKFDPANGDVMQQTSVPFNGLTANRPVLVGNTIWVVWSADGSGITLHGFNALTLGPVGPVTVSGGAPTAGEGLVAGGPGSSDLYVAAGNAVAVVDPSSNSVVRRISVPGTVTSVALSPDGSTVYAGFTGGGSFHLGVYDASTGAQRGMSSMHGSAAGYLVASDGGVWFTTGTAMLQRAWFAPNGQLSAARMVTGGEDGGLDSVPTYANGVVWVGGTQSLQCLNPSTGKTIASVAIPADGGVPEHFGSVAFASGHIYATYQDLHSQLEGIAAVSPPSACAG